MSQTGNYWDQWLPARLVEEDGVFRYETYDPHEASMAKDTYYDDDEPTLEAEAVNPLQDRCNFIEWQARLYWLDEPKVKAFIEKMSEGRGRDEEDRISTIAWSRNELGLKADCYARAERAWDNTK